MQTLIEKNSSAYRFNVEMAVRIDRICKPLSRLGVSTFFYGKIFNNGEYFFISNNLKYNEAYFSTIKNQETYATKVISCRTLGEIYRNKYRYLLIPSDINLFDKKKDPIIYLLHDFKMFHLFCLYKDQINCVEFYNFFSTNINTQAMEFYLKHLELLEHFIEYFHDKARDVIDISDKQKLAYFDQTFNFPAPFTKRDTPLYIKRFMEEISFDRLIIKSQNKDIKLTSREIECLQYLSLGYSLKEIGKALNLSPRTIEFYLSNIKQRTGFSSRAEMLTYFIKVMS